MPAVSVIVPVYNVDKYIDRCLQSIVSQSFSDIEIILINDGSKDASESVCLQWASQDNRIIYVRKKNEGAGPTRNLGIQMASAEFIAFCDSDDWYDERFIETMLTKQQDTGADIVVCGYCAFDGRTAKVISTTIPSLIDVEMDRWFRCERKLPSSVSVSMCVKLVKKSLYIEYDIKMPAGNGEDTAIHYFIMTVARKVAVVEYPLYYYWTTRHGSASSNSKRLSSYTVSFLSYGWDLFRKAGLFEYYKKPLLREAYYEIWLSYRRTTDDTEFSDNLISDCAKALKAYFDDISIFCNAASSKRIIGYGALGNSAAYWLPILEDTPLYPTELWDARGGSSEVSEPNLSSLGKDDCLLCFPKGDVENELREQFKDAECLILYEQDIAQWYMYWLIANK